MEKLCSLGTLIVLGSQRTFLSERVRDLIKLPYQRSHLENIVIGGRKQNSNRECNIIFVTKRNNFKFNVNVIIFPKVTKQIPLISFDLPKSDQLQNLELTNPHFNNSPQIDLILGNDSEDFKNIDGIKKTLYSGGS